jgi:hypothetical protein
MKSSGKRSLFRLGCLLSSGNGAFLRSAMRADWRGARGGNADVSVRRGESHGGMAAGRADAGCGRMSGVILSRKLCGLSAVHGGVKARAGDNRRGEGYEGGRIAARRR